ncbi:Uncharacterized protein TCM_033845 [Theobroma cacao]|uniref:Uncharacterized protein n=1 Tax=Theobroma cacao TaxID=3641 RepID=A0A061FAU9_THECC|nr:Uncharacterized protein TCM_033845 [Theobroma cacao]
MRSLVIPSLISYRCLNLDSTSKHFNNDKSHQGKNQRLQITLMEADIEQLIKFHFIQIKAHFWGSLH